MGENGSGELGIDTTKNQLTPVKIDSCVVGIAAGCEHSMYLTSSYLSAYWPSYEVGGKWDDTIGWINDYYYPWVYSYGYDNWYYVYDGLNARPAYDSYWFVYYTPDGKDYGWGYVYPGSGWWCVFSDGSSKWVKVGDPLPTK